MMESIIVRPSTARTRRCTDVLLARLPSRSLDADHASSGIWWADPGDHSRRFRLRSSSWQVAGRLLAPTAAAASLDFTDDDISSIEPDGTGQFVRCAVRLVDASGTPIDGARVEQVWQPKAQIGIASGELDVESLLATASVVGEACGVEAVLEIESGDYGEVTARWELPEILPLIFG